MSRPSQHPGNVTNIAGSTTNYITTKLVFLSTNYTLLVAACEFLNNNGGTNSNAGDYQGIGRMQFVRVSDDNYDYQTGQFIQPITNQYTMVVNINYQAVAQTFQRVVTTPDFVFSAKDMASGRIQATGFNHSTELLLSIRATHPRL